jgi:EpsI family protein
MKGWPFVTAVVLLAAANVASAWLSRPEIPPPREPLGHLPLRVAERWTGREVGLDARTLEVLKLSDYVMRVYEPVPWDHTRGELPPGRTMETVRDQQAAAVWLYIGFYDSQRTGATYHSPKNCLPGSGWQMTEAAETPLVLPGSGRFSVNRVVIERELSRQMVLYWYQDRGRGLADEYSAKFYLIWDAMTRNRTDGAIIRVTTPIVGEADEAFAHGVRFLTDVWPLVVSRLPS